MLLWLATASAAPGFLQGCWESDGAREVWIGPQQGVMVGMVLTPKGAWEHLQIEPKGDRFQLVAKPSGQTETLFVSTRLTATEAVFENPLHDFPQRLHYTRTAAGLNARVETLDGKKGFDMVFKTCGPDLEPSQKKP